MNIIQLIKTIAIVITSFVIGGAVVVASTLLGGHLVAEFIPAIGKLQITGILAAGATLLILTISIVYYALRLTTRLSIEVRFNVAVAIAVFVIPIVFLIVTKQPIL